MVKILWGAPKLPRPPGGDFFYSDVLFFLFGFNQNYFSRQPKFYDENCVFFFFFQTYFFILGAALFFVLFFFVCLFFSRVGKLLIHIVVCVFFSKKQVMHLKLLHILSNKKYDI